jgi:large conductance mechanosensitive channel
MSLVTDFKEFVLRGNVVDLAVGVLIGGAFGTVVKAFTADIITPLIGIPGKVDLSGLSVKFMGATFLIGDFINAIIAFIILALVIFLAVIKPVNYLMSHQAQADPTTKECPKCLSVIPVAATKCSACTTDL